MLKRQIEGSYDDEIYDFTIHKKLINKESNETKIKRFGLKIREKSLFQTKQKSELNLGENEEQFDFNDEINYLNLF